MIALAVPGPFELLFLGLFGLALFAAIAAVIVWAVRKGNRGR
jgi:uncharacterized membrane protein